MPETMSVTRPMMLLALGTEVVVDTQRRGRGERVGQAVKAQGICADRQSLVPSTPYRFSHLGLIFFVIKGCQGFSGVHKFSLKKKH
jgi:hypothetical protein